MISVSFVPCNNGLGHIRRLVFFVNKIKKNGKIFFFVDKKKIKKFKLKKKINIKYIKSNSLNYINQIFKNKSLDNSKIIVSDNLIHKKLTLKKTILFANFLWEEILNKNKKNLKILKNKNIKIFSNYLFCNIKEKIKIKKIGFFDKFRPSKKNNAVLIATGSAQSRLLKQFKKKIIDSIKKDRFKRKRIYLDPNIYSNSLKKYSVIKATFTKKMYSEITFAMIKPGLGTVEECLIRGIPIVPIMNNENKEFLFNSRILKEKKLGYVFKNLDQSVNFINKNFKNTFFLNKFRNRCKKLKWNGEKELISYLNKITY